MQLAPEHAPVSVAILLGTGALPAPELALVSAARLVGTLRTPFAKASHYSPFPTTPSAFYLPQLAS